MRNRRTEWELCGAKGPYETDDADRETACHVFKLLSPGLKTFLGSRFLATNTLVVTPVHPTVRPITSTGS
jgi:hypothetical protein